MAMIADTRSCCTNFFAAATDVDGSGASTVTISTGWPSIPPLELVYSAQAFNVAGAVSTLDPAGPVVTVIAPNFTGVPDRSDEDPLLPESPESSDPQADNSKLAAAAAAMATRQVARRTCGDFFTLCSW
jgi:hypothetical protein